MEISPDFSTAGLVLTVPLVGYVLGEWLIGKRSYGRMLATRDHDPNALTRMLRLWIAVSWAATAAALAVLGLSPGIAAADLGLAMPADPSTTVGIIAVVALLLPLAAVFLHREARKGKRAPSTVPEMHPRTAGERRWMVGLAVTAGICEEIVYRGFLIAVGVGVLGLDVKAAAGLALALFVAGHAYQGWKGLIPVAVTGCMLTYLYLSTGSLLAAVAVHIAIDLIALVIVPAVTGRTARTGADRRDAAEQTAG